ncbi:hypothetical protein KFL_005580070 [Klebsormidium nitens]|uniref:Methyltransferase FkbM domain-containing protein n=1 Tax=Klebsormidium nitens TaxID=105231 RepID=A0A0U9HKK3_KLENI|nr:hypothetical protein KFL_005580070 [Klebsormidium nitens]|eukprot:GAQ89755.1 hypothetical protein KFL_005580070 [Klebsormidium nitens]
MKPAFGPRTLLHRIRGRLVFFFVALVLGCICLVSNKAVGHLFSIPPHSTAPEAADSGDWSTYKHCFRPDRLSPRRPRAIAEQTQLYHLAGAQLSELLPLQTAHVGGGIPWSAVTEKHPSLLTHEIVRESKETPAQAARWSISTPPEADGFLHVLVGKFPCAEHGLCALPWLIRPNSTDMRSLWNHFLENEYGLLLDAQNFDPEYILDAGGVGMAPVFFALLYPQATILRLDPHPSNFHVGLLNSLRLPNIKQVNLGLWDKETTLQMCDNVDIEWGPDWPFEGSQQQAYFSREPSDPPCKKVAVDGIHVARLSSIMQTYNIPRFDLMKVDIEGAEFRAFKEPSMKRILSETTLFLAELHDWVIPGAVKSVRDAFRAVGGFTHFAYDENDAWIRTRAISACHVE